jgi:hypothetical protein
VAQVNWTDDVVALLVWMFEIERLLGEGLEGVSPLDVLTTPAQPLKPTLRATQPASAAKKSFELLLAERAAVSIFINHPGTAEAQKNSHQFPYAVWRLLTATGLSNWTTDANEGNAVGRT